jgi:alpha-beta hydrolase superfamily lysophospholipase
MRELSCRESLWCDPSSNRKLAYRLWQGPTSQALVVILHGFGEHGGRYQALAQALAVLGVCVAAPDLWGHGRSGGKRGDIESVARCAEDIRRLIERVLLPASAQSAYAMFGHSFGGLVAIHHAMSAPPGLRRLVVQSPFLGVDFPIPTWKQIVARVLAYCLPTYSLPMNLDVSALSRDPRIIEAYRADPLVHNQISARSYRSIVAAQDEAMARAGDLKVPVFLMCGGEDRIVSVALAEQWFRGLRCQKRFIKFPGCYHELHHEPVREEVFRLIVEWTVNAAV